MTLSADFIAPRLRRTSAPNQHAPAQHRPRRHAVPLGDRAENVLAGVADWYELDAVGFLQRRQMGDMGNSAAAHEGKTYGLAHPDIFLPTSRTQNRSRTSSMAVIAGIARYSSARHDRPTVSHQVVSGSYASPSGLATTTV